MYACLHTCMHTLSHFSFSRNPCGGVVGHFSGSWNLTLVELKPTIVELKPTIVEIPEDLRADYS